MKIVNNTKHKEITKYKIGMVIRESGRIYLVIKGYRGFSLLNLETNCTLQYCRTLEELFNEFHSITEYEINATLTVEALPNE